MPINKSWCHCIRKQQLELVGRRFYFWADFFSTGSQMFLFIWLLFNLQNVQVDAHSILSLSCILLKAGMLNALAGVGQVWNNLIAENALFFLQENSQWISSGTASLAFFIFFPKHGNLFIFISVAVLMPQISSHRCCIFSKMKRSCTKFFLRFPLCQFSLALNSFLMLFYAWFLLSSSSPFSFLPPDTVTCSLQCFWRSKLFLPPFFSLPWKQGFQLTWRQLERKKTDELRGLRSLIWASLSFPHLIPC